MPSTCTTYGRFELADSLADELARREPTVVLIGHEGDSGPDQADPVESRRAGSG